MVTKGETWQVGINQDLGIKIHTLLYIKQITNKDLLSPYRFWFGFFFSFSHRLSLGGKRVSRSGPKLSSSWLRNPTGNRYHFTHGLNKIPRSDACQLWSRRLGHMPILQPISGAQGIWYSHWSSWIMFYLCIPEV